MIIVHIVCVCVCVCVCVFVYGAYNTMLQVGKPLDVKTKFHNLEVRVVLCVCISACLCVQFLNVHDAPNISLIF